MLLHLAMNGGCSQIFVFQNKKKVELRAVVATNRSAASRQQVDFVGTSAKLEESMNVSNRN